MPVGTLYNQYWSASAVARIKAALKKAIQRAYGLIPKPSVDNARHPGGPHEGHPGWNSHGHSGWKK